MPSVRGVVLAVSLAAASLCAQDPPPANGATPQQPGNAGPTPPQQTATPGNGQQPAAPQKGIVVQIGDTTVKFGGFVKVDLIHDFDQIGSPDSFDPRTIPTDDESDPGMATRIHARQTRFNVDIRGPTSIGPGRAFVEGDFFGDNSTFRLRHAYVTLEGWLVGQTWSTFMDDDALPETLDFESPIGFPQVRQGLIRYTHQLGEGSYAAVALEDPQSKIIAPAVAGSAEEPVPDLTGRLYWKHGLGHTQLGLFASAARFAPKAGSPDNLFLWGVNLSNELDVSARDQAIAQVTYGPGIGRFRGGITAAPDANDHLQAVEMFAVMGALQHHWCEQWRSNVTYSWAKGNLPAGTPADTSQKLDYFAVNLIWQFCDKAWCGVEYLHGSNETFDDHRGEANRVQFSVRYDF
jgi:hypothetical protein